MDTSIFTDKYITPDEEMLKEALGDLYKPWKIIRDYVFAKYPAGTEEWNFSSPKYGWSFRIKDKKRAIIYLLPRRDFFLVAFVYGEKATKAALESNISGTIKELIETARVYAEGRGFRIEIRDFEILENIKLLIDIKLAS